METPPLPDAMPDGSLWPAVSIVSPSFNQGWCIEETLRSLLLQGYPNLETIVMDGGSTDESVALIRKYEPWLAHWTSGRDAGQTDALIRGFARATGTVFGWLNSDDVYLPNALGKLMLLRARSPSSVGWVGAAQEIDRDGKPLRFLKPNLRDKDAMFDWGTVPGSTCTHFYQPSCLFSADAYRKAGGLDPFILSGMDLDLWVRLRGVGEFALTEEAISSPRLYAGTKSGSFTLREAVDMVAIAQKLERRDLAERSLRDYEANLRREWIANLTPAEAMKGLTEESFMDKVPLGAIASHALRRVVRAMRRLLSPGKS